MISAYLILAEGPDSIDVDSVYIGKQDGARKAMAARQAKDKLSRTWRVEPIEVVDTFGGVR